MAQQGKQRAIAVDFDGTLVIEVPPPAIGKPVEEMVKKVKDELAQGTQVFIFSARVNPDGHNYEAALAATEAVLIIADFCREQFNMLLPITHEKLSIYDAIYDDKAIQIIKNTGVSLDELVGALEDSK